MGASTCPSFDYHTSAAPSMEMIFTHGRKLSLGNASSSTRVPRGQGETHHGLETRQNALLVSGAYGNQLSGSAEGLHGESPSGL